MVRFLPDCRYFAIGKIPEIRQKPDKSAYNIPSLSISPCAPQSSPVRGCPRSPSHHSVWALHLCALLNHIMADPSPGVTANPFYLSAH